MKGNLIMVPLLVIARKVVTKQSQGLPRLRAVTHSGVQARATPSQ